ncbi:MAG: 3-isopropylmalate dehydratase [Chloroflexi bacterium]|nr:3-isopropylmalate dehydratase [Chloroflexota bacterium]
MQDILKGKVAIKLGDIINSDLMSPPEYMWQMRDPQLIAKVCFTNYDPEFPKRVRPGDFVVAGQGFGHGHLHMGGMAGMKGLSVAAVICESVAPGWYRGAVNGGFPVITCPDITKKVNEGDELEVNVKTGIIKNLTSGESIQAEPVPPIIRAILDAGGIAGYTEKKLASTPAR